MLLRQHGEINNNVLVSGDARFSTTTGQLESICREEFWGDRTSEPSPGSAAGALWWYFLRGSPLNIRGFGGSYILTAYGKTDFDLSPRFQLIQNLKKNWRGGKKPCTYPDATLGIVVERTNRCVKGGKWRAGNYWARLLQGDHSHGYYSY